MADWADEAAAGIMANVRAEGEEHAERMIAVALRAWRRKGREEMRERAAESFGPCAKMCGHGLCEGKREALRAVRALPLEEPTE